MISLDDLIAQLPESERETINELARKLIVEQSKIPIVGKGATKYVGSDRYPYTVVEVIHPKRIVVQADRAVNTAVWPDQKYEYTRCPEGAKTILTWRSGAEVWREVGESVRHGAGWYVGDRQCYQDPSF